MQCRNILAVAHRTGQFLFGIASNRLRDLSHLAIGSLVLCGAVIPAAAQTAPPISVASYDFDGDGFEDGLFPVEFGDSPGEGWSSLDVYSVELGQVLFSIDPEGDASIVGRSVAVAGDVDGDGHDDILIGSPSAVRPDGVRVGAATVYSGFDGAILMQVGGYPGILFGVGVAPAGDHNGDGWLDFAVTLVREVSVGDTIDTYSEVHVYDTGTGRCIAQYASGIAGDGFGAAVADMGDLDGDGHDDLAITSPYADAGGGLGAVYLFRGKAGVAGQIWHEGLGGASSTISGMGGPDLLFGVGLVPIWDDVGEEVTGLAVCSQGMDGVAHEFTEYSLGGAFITSKQFARVFPAGDVDGSQRVDSVDLQNVVESIGITEVDAVPFGVDLDQNGSVDVSDLSILVENYDLDGPLRGALGVGAASLVESWTEPLRCWPQEDICVDIPNEDGSIVPPTVNPGDGPNGLDDNGAGGNGWNNGGGTNPPGNGIDPDCVRPLNGCPADFYVNMPCDDSEAPLKMWFSSPWGSGSHAQVWMISEGLSLDAGYSLFDSAIRVVVNEPGAHYVAMTVTLGSDQNCGSACNFEAVQRCIDLDIDSDNDNGYGLPEGSDEEDEVEDVSGDDENPGKVILVNSGMSDIDVFPDFLDGYDWNPHTADDDHCQECKFVPIEIRTSYLENLDSIVRITYSNSDPLSIGIDSEGWVFDEGFLRLWSKNGSQSRDPRAIYDDGDYIPSGEYSLEELGAIPGQALILYVEALKPSENVADIVIQVDLDPDGNGSFESTDRVRLTAVDVDLLVLNPEDGEYRPTPILLTANLYDADDPEQVEIAESNYSAAVQKFQIRDPRDLSGFVFMLGEEEFAFVEIGGMWETEPFWVDSPPYFSNPGGAPDPSDARRIEDMPDNLEWEYNPRETIKRAKIPNPKGSDALFQKHLDAVVAELESDIAGSWLANYPNPNESNGSAFGKETHSRIASRLNGKPGWISNVYFDKNTRQLLSIGSPPVGGTVGTVEIDIIKIKKGQVLSIGDVYDPSKIDGVWEVKTSVTGKISTSQYDKYENITGGRKFVTAVPRRKFSSTGWADHPTGGGLYSAQKIVTGIAVVSTIIAISYPVDLEPYVEDTLSAYNELSNTWEHYADGPVSAAAFGQALGRQLTARTGQDLTAMTTIICTYSHLYFQE